MQVAVSGTENPVALHDFVAHLRTDQIALDGTVGALEVWARHLLEPSPSAETLAIARIALAELRDRNPAPAPAARFFELLAELHLLSDTGYAPMSDVAARVEDGILAIAPEEQLHYAPALRHAFNRVIDAYIRECQLHDAERALSRRGAQDDDERYRVSKAFVLAMRGEVAEATELLPRFAPPSAVSVRERIVRAAVMLEQGEAAAARAVLGPIEHISQATMEWPYAVIVASRIETVIDPQGGFERIRQHLAQRGRLPVARRLRRLLHSAVADLALAAGEMHWAKSLVAERDPEDHALRITAARIALTAKDHDALEDLRDLLADHDVWPRLRAQAFLIRAVHLHRGGLTDDARVAVRRGLAITGALNIRLIHALVPRSDLEAIAAGSYLRIPGNVNDANPLREALLPMDLTGRETVLLTRLASADTLKQIAESEFVTLSTVKSQANSLYRKLGARSRGEAVEIAHRRGIVS